jgi:CRISPR-associated protein Csx14
MLTPAEKEVVRLACRGLSTTAITGQLHKKQQIVANQLTKVFEKFTEWRGSWESPDRAQLVAEFAPYFSLMERDEQKGKVYGI